VRLSPQLFPSCLLTPFPFVCAPPYGLITTGALYGSPETIRKETTRMLKEFGTQRLIANLGHGMHPTHKPENLKAFLEAVQEVCATVCHVCRPAFVC
jgi:hypothetical protein